MWTFIRRSRSDACSRTEQQLSAYIDQRLNPRELHQVDLHLADCQGCERQLQSLQATVDLLHQLPQASAPRSFRIAQPEPARRWTPVPVLRLATAAAAMLLIMAFTADLTNLFDTSPSPLDQQAGTYSYTDNRSAAIEGDNLTRFWGSPPNDSQQLNPPSAELPETAEAGWVRPLVYGLAVVVVVLGSISVWLWLKPKRRTGHRAA